MTTNTQQQTQQSGGDELDVFGREFLDCAGRFKEMMQGTATSFPDITGADMWGKLYYAGVLPNIIKFVILEGQARERAALYGFHEYVIGKNIIQQESDQAYNYARLHRALDAYIAELQLKPQAGEGGEG